MPAAGQSPLAQRAGNLIERYHSGKQPERRLAKTSGSETGRSGQKHGFKPDSGKTAAAGMPKSAEFSQGDATAVRSPTRQPYL